MSDGYGTPDSHLEHKGVRTPSKVPQRTDEFFTPESQVSFTSPYNSVAREGMSWQTPTASVAPQGPPPVSFQPDQGVSTEIKRFVADGSSSSSSSSIASTIEENIVLRAVDSEHTSPIQVASPLRAPDTERSFSPSEEVHHDEEEKEQEATSSTAVDQSTRESTPAAAEIGVEDSEQSSEESPSDALLQNPFSVQAPVQQEKSPVLDQMDHSAVFKELEESDRRGSPVEVSTDRSPHSEERQADTPSQHSSEELEATPEDTVQETEDKPSISTPHVLPGLGEERSVFFSANNSFVQAPIVPSLVEKARRRSEPQENAESNLDTIKEEEEEEETSIADLLHGSESPMVFTIFFMEDEDRNAIVLRREEEMHCLYKAFASFLDVFKLVNIPTSARPEPSSDLQGNALSTTSDKPTWKSTLDKSDLGIKGVLHNYSQPSDRFSSWSNKTSSQVGSWAPTAFSNRNTNTSVESSSTRGYRLRYGNAQHGSVLRADPSPVRSRTYFPKGRFGEESALSWNSDSILQRSAIPRDAGASFHASHGNSFSDYQWRRPSRLADRWTPTTTRSAGPTGFDGLWSSRAEGRSPLLERSLDAKPDNEAQERVENPPYTVTPVERRSPRRTPRKEPTAAPRQGDFGGIVVSSKLLVKSVSRRVPELQVGDKVVCIDGKRVTSLDDLRERMNTDLPRETLVTVKRGDVRKVIKLTPTAAHGEARWVY